ncbi:peroxide stress protein YaaA, partial [Klebsiella pneumoniae]|nr:peroxide stress protein YaaA [Klebsiella pneumoniae]
MFFVLSPAKNLNEKDPAPVSEFTQPDLLAESDILMQQLRELAPQQIAELMHVSDKIALLNAQRNAEWNTPFTPENAKQAVFMFNGDVYEGMDANTLDIGQIRYLQNHVRLLSGLYGLLRPLDLIQPYRLEMGTAFANLRGKNLYEFWGDIITNLLNDTLA